MSTAQPIIKPPSGPLRPALGTANSVYSVSRACGYCGADISHKRRQALFCCDQHRAEFRNERLRRKNPPAVGAVAAGREQQQTKPAHPTTTAHPNKFQRVLGALIAGKSLNRLDAERLGDHILNSTIARVRRLGIVVSQRMERISASDGSTLRCCRYWLEPAERMKASALLNAKTVESPANSEAEGRE